MLTYLLLNFFTILIPFARSFEPKIQFYKKWTALFTAITITGAFFLAWDYFFTKMGVWSFNDDYLVGFRMLGMPIEEWLFFVTVPYACVFVYEVLKFFVKKQPLTSVANKITIALIIALIVIGAMSTDRLYTSITFFLTAFLLLVHLLVIRANYMGYFYTAYAICLVPFGVVNGILTSLPVVEYNNLENMNIRLGSIPLEDSMYMLLLLLMNVMIYEKMKKVVV